MMWKKVSTFILCLSLSSSTQGDDWNGSAHVLQANEQLTMRRAPAQGWLLTVLNVSTKADLGELGYTRAGQAPVFVEVPALDSSALLLEAFGKGNPLVLSNVSDSAPIQLTAFGPGFGQTMRLILSSQPQPLPLNHARETISQTSYMRLVFQANTGLTRFLFIVGKDLYIVCVNTPVPNPAECNADMSTSDNRFSIVKNWQGKNLYVANLSGGTDSDASLILISLRPP